MAFEPTDDSFVRGYWYHRPAESFPPPPHFEISSSFSDRTLCLAGVPGCPPISKYKERKIIAGWAEILPSLASVEMLWVAPKVSQRLFDAIGVMPNLVGLHIEHSSIKTIVSNSFSNLRFLHLGSSPGLLDLEGLAQCTSLEWLETENLKRITDFSLLSRLTSLVGLGINGGMWTTQRIDSLAPLEALQQLRFLSITNARVTDQSLRSLHNLEHLQTLQRALWWPDSEIRDLLEANPRLATPT
ncbi:MAG: hypothetical protein P8J91_10305 [Pirellulaceae bacterium]|nr:hypothetical protein [Pirellulaceae bacterium]MDG2104132.1 hypothetical protein [Pirellulaceae bacterium]